MKTNRSFDAFVTLAGVIAVIALMIMCTNPVGSHAIAKGAYSHGYRPEKKMETDDLGRDFDE